MKVVYCRVSTLDQNTDRQKVKEKEFNLVVEDKCSGGVPFFERAGGKEIKNLIDKGVRFSLSVLSIDRLGRDLKDLINTIDLFTSHKISIHFISQGLSTLDESWNENAIAKMIISILGVVAEMKESQILERQREGIAIAKMKGIYKGRIEGSKEDLLTFLGKEKNKLALSYLKKGYKAKEAAKLADVHINTITRIKKLAFVVE